MIKWIGQHIIDLIARFRSDVYLESLSSTTETDMLVVDSDGKVSKRAIDAVDIDVSDFMTNGVDNRVVTATGADAMNAEADLTFTSETLSIGADDDGTAVITRLAHSDELGGHFEIKAGNAGGTDKVGGTLSLYSGAGTGTAYGGDIRFYAGNRAGSTGSSNNLPTLMATIDGSAGDFVMSGIDTISGKTDSDFSIKSDGKLKFYIDGDDDETSQYFEWLDNNDEVMRLTEKGNLRLKHTGGDDGEGLLLIRDDATTAADDILGSIGFDSSDGNIPSRGVEASAYIAAYASEDHATTDKGGYLVFGTSTTDDNDDTTSHEWMRI